jgi:hypothetical protein
MLAVLPEYPSVGESFTYQLSGLFVVFMALGGIWALLEVIGGFFRRADARRIKPPETVTPPAATVEVEPVIAPLTSALIAATVHSAFEGRARILSATPEDPLTYALIAVAVHSVFEGRARIVSVNPLHTDPSWAREGRRDIFSSHRIR